MKDADCVAFLQWALPQLGLRWAGYRKVRRRACKRIGRRMRELGVADAAAYRARLQADPAEWRALAALCPIPISRFYRDREVFDCLGAEALPEREFDLVLCRNLAFTYFDAAGGALVIGLHEQLPAPAAGFEPWPGCRAVFRRSPLSTSS